MPTNASEEWLPVVGWEDAYEVSSQGRVRSIERRVSWRGRLRLVKEHYLSGTVTDDGYIRVHLCANGIRRSRLVHNLVLESFVGPRPEGLQGCHWDDDGANNALSNLRWDTPSKNVFDAVRNGGHANANKSKCIAGHDLTDDNIYIWSQRPNERNCRTCRRERQRV